MKIFFLQKTNRKKVFEITSSTLLITLLSALIISQATRIFFSTSSQVSSPEVISDKERVSLFTSPLKADDNVYVLIDGERHSKITNNKAEFFISSPVTVEIMSENVQSFSVSLVAGDNVEFVGKSQSVVCQKGINLICRCMVN